MRGDRGTSAKHDLSLHTNASFDLPGLLGDLNNKICLSKNFLIVPAFGGQHEEILEAFFFWLCIHINVLHLFKTCRVR